jgi:hypothetical protein
LGRAKPNWRAVAPIWAVVAAFSILSKGVCVRSKIKVLTLI